jgi:hypothetical protein
MRLKKLPLILLIAVSIPLFAQAAPADWERHARNVEIIRDDWGIPHVHGKTDADAASKPALSPISRYEGMHEAKARPSMCGSLVA